MHSRNEIKELKTIKFSHLFSMTDLQKIPLKNSFVDEDLRKDWLLQGTQLIL